MNSQKRAEFATQFATTVCNIFYARHDLALGHDLLKISPSLQVNMLLVNELSHVWSREMDQFRSVYFNFDHEEVTEAYQKFKNIVSKHIAIRRSEMEPLLQACANRYLLWVTDFKSFADQYLAEGLEIAPKFIKIYTGAMDTLQNDKKIVMPEDTEQQMALKLLNSEFSEVLSGWIPLVHEFTPDKSSEKEVEEAKPEKVNLTKKESSLLEKLNSGKQKPILEHLTINQKIMFQRSLFSGNIDEMQMALKTAETLESFDQALDYISTHFAAKYQWDFESDEVTELLELLEFRFKK